MKKLSFHYHLKLNMDAPVTGHHFTLRCTPANDGRQKIENLQRYIFPCDYLAENSDGWGNSLIYGACKAVHSGFEANICGSAETGLADSVPLENPGWEHIFRFPTALTRADAALRQCAAGLYGADALDIARDAMEKIALQLVYTPGSTDVATTAAEAFALGTGVCQDYSHIMLALLRERGIPCRYVVGMLLGEGKSHAWVEALYRGRWYGFDPTNRQIVTDRHIKLSHGRDYGDCNINKGLFLGTANQKAEISAIVTEI